MGKKRKRQDSLCYLVLFWWWEDEKFCFEHVRFEMLVRHSSCLLHHAGHRSDHITHLLQTLYWLPISVVIKSKVLTMAQKVFFWLLLTTLIPLSSFFPSSLLQAHSSSFLHLRKLPMSFLPQGFFTYPTFCLKSLFPLCLSLTPTLVTWLNFNSSELLPWPFYLKLLPPSIWILYPCILINFSP